MTKEEALLKFYTQDMSEPYGHVPTDVIYKAMDEYAKEVAFGLAKFADDNHYRRNRASNMWFDNNFNFITEDELFNQYIQSIK
jgi:hypothetical protein